MTITHGVPAMDDDLESYIQIEVVKGPKFNGFDTYHDLCEAS